MKELFSKRLKALREEKKYSQDDLAKELNISRNSIYFYENNKRVPDANTIIALSEYFGVSTDYLLGLSEDKNETESKRVTNRGNAVLELLEGLDAQTKNHILIALKDLITCSSRDKSLPMCNTLLERFCELSSVYADMIDITHKMTEDDYITFLHFYGYGLNLLEKHKDDLTQNLKGFKAIDVKMLIKERYEDGEPYGNNPQA